jgi:biopolymer transport protein ExbB
MTATLLMIRKQAWFWGLLLCALLVVAGAPRRSTAAPPKPAAAAEAKAAPAEAKPAAATEEPMKEAPTEEGFLHWVIRCSGFIGLVILLLSIYFVSTVGRLFWEMRMEVASPPELTAQCQSLLEQHDFKGIYGLVRASES